MMNIDLSDQVALVTGASRGIGKAIALSLAEHGAFVIGTATSESGATAISTYLKEANLDGVGIALNVTNEDSVNDLAEYLKQHEYVPVILVNNAGITRDNLLMRMKNEEWDDVITTNLSSMFKISKLCLRGMMKQKYGRIINITSVVAHSGNPGQSNYAASKAGILGFTKSMAREVASRNITVNAVAPGFIETDMTEQMTDDQKSALLTQIPAARLGKPEDIAKSVLYLASSSAGYITGETINVNGGMFMA
jgi:3-oxoacyl-[acyl-carrier protein] reductase